MVLNATWLQAPPLRVSRCQGCVLSPDKARVGGTTPIRLALHPMPLHLIFLKAPPLGRLWDWINLDSPGCWPGSQALCFSCTASPHLHRGLTSATVSGLQRTPGLRAGQLAQAQAAHGAAGSLREVTLGLPSLL